MASAWHARAARRSSRPTGRRNASEAWQEDHDTVATEQAEVEGVWVGVRHVAGASLERGPPGPETESREPGVPRESSRLQAAAGRRGRERLLGAAVTRVAGDLGLAGRSRLADALEELIVD